MTSPKLSVVIPVYNEKETVLSLLQRVMAVDLDKELVIVDDGSTDGTSDVLAQAANWPGVRVFYQPLNKGKGAALRRGFQEARGEYVIIQDADFEYAPEEFPRLLAPLDEGRADVAYGSRFLVKGAKVRWPFRLANWALTVWSNILTGQKLTDVWTCYKVFRRPVLQGLSFQENRFGFEAEVTAKLAKAGHHIVEVPVSYFPRTKKEGKKIGLSDGLRGLYVTAKYNWARSPAAAEILPQES